MKTLKFLTFALLSFPCFAKPLPMKYIELIKYVQPAPDQGETNTCIYIASTGVMELLLNKKYDIISPKGDGPYDLAESFLIWQSDFYNQSNQPESFIEEIVQRFNFGEAINAKFWSFKSKNADNTDNWDVWSKHPEYDGLPRMDVPQLETELLFAKGGKRDGGRWSTNVLEAGDLTIIKEALFKYKSPVLANYNDDGYWHVVMIVGFDDNAKGDCYEIEAKVCNSKGSFYVRDSNGKNIELRAYNWFLEKGNTAASVRFK